MISYLFLYLQLCVLTCSRLYCYFYPWEGWCNHSRTFTPHFLITRSNKLPESVSLNFAFALLMVIDFTCDCVRSFLPLVGYILSHLLEFFVCLLVCFPASLPTFFCIISFFLPAWSFPSACKHLVVSPKENPHYSSPPTAAPVLCSPLWEISSQELPPFFFLSPWTLDRVYPQSTTLEALDRESMISRWQHCSLSC